MPKGKSRSAVYYQNNKEAREKKKKYDAALNARPNQRKKRSELVQKNRDADKRGVDRKGKDYDHAVGKYVSIKTNRGRNNGTAGDKRSRGKKK